VVPIPKIDNEDYFEDYWLKFLVIFSVSVSN
jgi:hypothetical protein